MKRKLSVEVTEEQYTRLEIIPWGIKTKLFNVIIDDLLNAINKVGPAVIGHIIARHIVLSDWSDIKPTPTEAKADPHPHTLKRKKKGKKDGDS